MKQYKDIPNQRKPWTVQLQTRLEKISRDKVHNSLISALQNGLISSNRRCEVLQPGFNRNPEKPQLDDRGDPYAFMLGDATFFGANRRTVIPHVTAIQYPTLVFFVEKRYQVQKNGDNDAKKSHARNTVHPHLCNVKH